MYFALYPYIHFLKFGTVILILEHYQKKRGLFLLITKENSVCVSGLGLTLWNMFNILMHIALIKEKKKEKKFKKYSVYKCVS